MQTTVDLSIKPVLYKIMNQLEQLIELNGTYSSMSNNDIIKDAKFLGFFIKGETYALSIKCTGPREKVNALKNEFLEFSQSIQLK